jgi:hypothetical protein
VKGRGRQEEAEDQADDGPVGLQVQGGRADPPAIPSKRFVSSVQFSSYKKGSKRPIHRRDAEHAEKPFFPLAGGAANGKPLMRCAKFYPLQAVSSFLKSVFPDFRKNIFLGVLRVSAVEMSLKRLTCYVFFDFNKLVYEQDYG